MTAREPSQTISKKTNSARLRALLLTSLFTLLLALQLYQLTARLVVPSLNRIWQLRNMPAWQRSALQQGDDIGLYIEFLLEQIPPNARVMLPPTTPPRPVAHMGFMQYYLFPRELHNCGHDEVPACLARIENTDFYILAVEGFPPPHLEIEGMRFVEFDESKGLYLPE